MTAKPETKVRRVRRFCEKLIARAAVVEDRYGKAGAHAEIDAADVAKRILHLLEAK